MLQRPWRPSPTSWVSSPALPDAFHILSRLQHFQQWIAALLIRGVIHFLGATVRLELARGEEHLEALRGGGEPVVLSFWHNRAVFCAYLVYRRLLSRAVPITILVSQSRDGELGAKLARMWRAGVVRGSASRGGAAGLRKLYRVVSRQKASAITIPDGPRGPLYEAKPGAVVLAQMCGVPILPMAFAADRFWTVRSWDRLIIPKPFARVRFVVGDPLEIPRELDAEELEGQRQRLEKTLNDLVAEAEASEPGTKER